MKELEGLPLEWPLAPFVVCVPLVPLDDEVVQVAGMVVILEESMYETYWLSVSGRVKMGVGGGGDKPRHL